jgi:uncharacterized OB-fold protein
MTQISAEGQILAEGGPDIAFQKFLAEGRFMIQRGVGTGVHVYYPRTVAPKTGEALEWVEASGKGTVHSVSVIHKRDPEPNYNVALIDLAEGVRMMSRVDGIDPAQVKIGMAVRARIVPHEEGHIVVFVPEGENGQ